MNFFNRMKDSISSAGTGVSQKVSYTADTAKLNNQIRSNEKEIEKLIYQVGQKCVQLHLSDTDSEYEELFAQIRQYQASSHAHQAEIQRLTEELKIQEQLRQQELKEKQERREQELQERKDLKQQQLQKRQEQEQMQAEMNKKAQLDRQLEIQKQLDETTKLCKNCSQRSDLDAKFCVFCGEPFTDAGTEVQEAAENIPEPVADTIKHFHTEK